MSINAYLSYIKRDGLAFSHSIKMFFRNTTITWTYPCTCVVRKHPGKVECVGYQLTFSLCHKVLWTNRHDSRACYGGCRQDGRVCNGGYGHNGRAFKGGYRHENRACNGGYRHDSRACNGLYRHDGRACYKEYRHYVIKNIGL